MCAQKLARTDALGSDSSSAFYKGQELAIVYCLKPCSLIIGFIRGKRKCRGNACGTP